MEMPDREKVIKGLECCASMNGSACRECPYSSECIDYEAIYQTGTAHLAADALELLKKQDAKRPNLMQDVEGIWATCPTCGHKLRAILANTMDLYFPKFCLECGQAVKWE